MSTFLSLIGIVGSFFLIKYRERAGDMIGDAAWMQPIGGIYNFLIIFSVFIFFFSVAALTGTTDIFFGWVRFLIPGQAPAPPAAGPQV